MSSVPLSISSFNIHLTEMFRNLQGVVSWKDTNSVYLGGNKAAIALFGFRNEEKIVGLTDGDLNCSASETLEQFTEQDRKVMQHKTALEIIDVNKFADGNVSIFQTKKIPIVTLEGTVGGILVQCLKISNPAYIDQILKAGTAFGNKNKLGSFFISPDFTDLGLSERELECIFYYLRGNTSKHIAKILNCSHRTVEAHIANVKTKLSVSTKNGLLEAAYSHDLLSYIPKNLVSNSSTYSLEDTSNDNYACIEKTQKNHQKKSPYLWHSE